MCRRPLRWRGRTRSRLTLLSVCTVMSALRSGSPSSSQTIFAAGNDPHASHLIGTGRPAVSSSFGEMIFTRSGFTVPESRVEGGEGISTERSVAVCLSIRPVAVVGDIVYLRCTWMATSFETAGTSFEPAARHCSFEPKKSLVTVLMNS